MPVPGFFQVLYFFSCCTWPSLLISCLYQDSNCTKPPVAVYCTNGKGVAKIQQYNRAQQFGFFSGKLHKIFENLEKHQAETQTKSQVTVDGDFILFHTGNYRKSINRILR